MIREGEEKSSKKQENIAKSKNEEAGKEEIEKGTRKIS